jgi:endonuclease-3 related protein
MPAASYLPNSVHPKMGMTKSVSTGVKPMPLSQTPELMKYFEALYAAYGPQDWWPGRSRFEVIVGAILTQNTSWANVEAALRNLRAGQLLKPRAIEKIPLRKLAQLIRASGYFREKAKKLKAFTKFLFANYAGSLSRMFRTSTLTLRGQLLAVHGIGPETADSILLYAGHHPVFVIDAYTRRILERHQIATAKHSYEELRSLFESSLPREHNLYSEYHALIVQTGKAFCRKSVALCSGCPLKNYLPASSGQ